VDVAEPLDGLGHGLVDLGAVADVDDDARALAAGLLDHGDGLVELGLRAERVRDGVHLAPDVATHHGRPLGRQREGVGATLAPRCARDDGDPSVELPHVRRPLSVAQCAAGSWSHASVVPGSAAVAVNASPGPHHAREPASWRPSESRTAPATTTTKA